MRAFPALFCLDLTSCSIFAEPLEVSSEHFHIVADSSTSSKAEMQALLDQGEAFHAAIVAISPPDMRPDPILEVRLNGRLRKQTPFVDGEGIVHLWRYSPEEGGYGAMFAHEIALHRVRRGGQGRGPRVAGSRLLQRRVGRVCGAGGPLREDRLSALRI